MIQRIQGLLLAVVVAAGMFVFETPAGAQSNETLMCQAAVRDRILAQRGDRAPVIFTSASKYRLSAAKVGVRGEGYVQAPGDVDRFRYDCSVSTNTGAVQILSLVAVAKPSAPAVQLPQPPARWTGDATVACQVAVRDRIWAQRGDRSPVVFTSARQNQIDDRRAGVRGDGFVRAPGDTDQFVYSCIIDTRNGSVWDLAVNPVQPQVRPEPPANWTGNPVVACQTAVRDRIWAQRGGRSPVVFTSADTYGASAAKVGVRGEGYVQAPGDVDRFGYDCAVSANTGAVTILSLVPMKKTSAPAYPQPPLNWTGNPSTACHVAVRDRIWQLRRDRSQVHFTSTDMYLVPNNNQLRRVRGTGQVFAPGDVDGFVYECLVGMVTGRVAILRLEGHHVSYQRFQRDLEHDN